MSVGDVRDLQSRFWSVVVSARQGWGRTGWQDFNIVAAAGGDRWRRERGSAGDCLALN
jgi:hypothetical protein